MSVSKEMAKRVEELGQLTLGQLHERTGNQIKRALGIAMREPWQCEEPAVRVTRVDLREKIFRSEGVPTRSGQVSVLAPPIVVGEDWDCVAAAAAKAGVSFLIQGPPGCGKSHQARAIVEACAPLRSTC